MHAQIQLAFHLICLLFLSDFNKTGIYQQILVKLTNSKIAENPLGAS
jgi:hypothetical protein